MKRIIHFSGWFWHRLKADPRFLIVNLAQLANLEIILISPPRTLATAVCLFYCLLIIVVIAGSEIIRLHRKEREIKQGIAVVNFFLNESLRLISERDEAAKRFDSPAAQSAQEQLEISWARAGREHSDFMRKHSTHKNHGNIHHPPDS